METNYGSIPDIAVLKMAEQDVLDPRDPTIYDWLVEITPDHNHELIINLPRDRSPLWVVPIRMSRLAFKTHKERWLYAHAQATKAWVEYWNPNKHIDIDTRRLTPAIINNDNFILGGAL